MGKIILILIYEFMPNLCEIVRTGICPGECLSIRRQIINPPTIELVNLFVDSDTFVVLYRFSVST